MFYEEQGFPKVACQSGRNDTTLQLKSVIQTPKDNTITSTGAKKLHKTYTRKLKAASKAIYEEGTLLLYVTSCILKEENA